MSMGHEGIISLKHYMDSELVEPHVEEEPRRPSTDFSALLSAYRSGLTEFGECGANACSSLAPDLKKGLGRIDDELGPHPDLRAIETAEGALRELLRDWGNRSALHYEQKAGEVRDLLLVMARAAEALGQKDDLYARKLDALTTQLHTIASLEDVTSLRVSIEKSACELQDSVARMTAESRAVVEHLRLEVTTYKTKLERAEYAASCDALTGLRSRRWIEAQIQQRIDAGSPFCVVMVEIENFRQISEEHGNLVGDLLLKEFANELRSSCRIGDLVGRWGAERFVVILNSDAEQATGRMARLHSWICGAYRVPGRSRPISVRLDAGLGLAEYQPRESLYELLERADAELCAHRGVVDASKRA